LEIVETADPVLEVGPRHPYKPFYLFDISLNQEGLSDLVKALPAQKILNQKTR
jgi:hypothetical protein